MSATLKDVAKLAKVAPSTVSGVLNGTTRVKPETRRRIMQAVEELNVSVKLTVPSSSSAPMR